jgi:hypothetical protein
LKPNDEENDQQTARYFRRERHFETLKPAEKGQKQGLNHEEKKG